MELVTRQAVLVGGIQDGAERRNAKQGEHPNYRRISFIDQATGRASDMELSHHVNGDAPKQGQKVALVVRLFPRDCSRERRDGTSYRTTLLDATCVGFEAA